MTYGLYNKKLDKKLTHPVVGVWYTTNYQEAEEMLTACHQYLEVSGLSHMKNDFAIIDVENGNEIIEEVVTEN